MVFLLVVALLIVILAAIFAAQNTAPVTVQFLFWQTREISLALVLLLTFIMGVVVSLLASLPGLIKRNRQIAGHRKKLAETEKQLATFKDRQAD